MDKHPCYGVPSPFWMPRPSLPLQVNTHLAEPVKTCRFLTRILVDKQIDKLFFAYLTQERFHVHPLKRRLNAGAIKLNGQ